MSQRAQAEFNVFISKNQSCHPCKFENKWAAIKEFSNGKTKFAFVSFSSDPGNTWQHYVEYTVHFTLCETGVIKYIKPGIYKKECDEEFTNYKVTLKNVLMVSTG